MMWVCRADYTRGFVEHIKRVIPPARRNWNPQDKTWSVDAAEEDVLLTILQAQEYDIRVLEEETTTPALTGASPEDTCKQFLLALPHDSLRAAYRNAAAKLHPDRGGSTEQFQNLNNLYQQITDILERERAQ